MRFLTDEGSVSPSVFSGIVIVCSILLLLLLHLFILLCFLKLADPGRHLLWGYSREEKGTAAALSPTTAANCVVCQSSLAEDGGALKVLPRCRHVFHISCIGRWLSYYSEKCPLCRTPARVEPPPVDRFPDVEEFPNRPLLYYA